MSFFEVLLAAIACAILGTIAILIGGVKNPSRSLRFKLNMLIIGVFLLMIALYLFAKSSAKT